MCDIERLPTATILTSDEKMIPVFERAMYGNKFSVVHVGLIQTPISFEELGWHVAPAQIEGLESTLEARYPVNFLFLHGCLNLLTQQQIETVEGLGIKVDAIGYPDSELQY